jgi:hypothetical protein
MDGRKQSLGVFWASILLQIAPKVRDRIELNLG